MDLEKTVDYRQLPKACMSTRLYNALNRAGYKKMADIMYLSEEEILNIPTIGKYGVQELLENRQKYVDYCLNNSPDDDEVGFIKTSNLVSLVRGALVYPESILFLDRLGKQFGDLDIQKEDFSTRTYNALKRNHIDTFKQLALYDCDVFRKLSFVGDGAVAEVLEVLDRRVVVFDSGNQVDSKDVSKQIEEICNACTASFGVAIDDNSKTVLKAALLSKDNEDIRADNDVVIGLMSVSPIKELLQDRIITNVGHTFAERINRDECMDRVLLKKAQYASELDSLLNELIDHKKIIVRGEYLYDSTPSFDEWLAGLSDQNRMLLSYRIDGYTLQEIGESIGLSRERVRQQLDKTIRNRPALLEDGYRYIYETYSFSETELEILLDIDRRTIVFFSLCGLKKGRQSVETFLDDTAVPSFIKERYNSPINEDHSIMKEIINEQLKSYDDQMKALVDTIFIPDIEELVLKFSSYVHSIDNQLFEKLDFYDKNRYLGSHEYYKTEMLPEVRSILDADSWSIEEIGTGKITECVISAVEYKRNNLINKKFGLAEFKERLCPRFGGYSRENERVLYDIYHSPDEARSFANAINLFGGKYPIIAYLFYLKDENRFLPVSPSNFDKSFAYMNVQFKMSKMCNWDNYCTFIAYIRLIKQVLNESEICCHEVSLLDAHSFVWILSHSQFQEKEREVQKEIREISKIEDSISSDVTGKERIALVKQRVNQSFFRKKLLKRYNKCCLCGVSTPELLIASHIKPWSESSPYEKTDADNGFLLCPNHDALFDKGFISLSDEGRVLISNQLLWSDCERMSLRRDIVVKLTENNKVYLDYHRKKHHFIRL